MKNETRTNFTVINGTEPESINIAEWQKEYPRYCAIVERDPNKDGYGWIRYRGFHIRLQYCVKPVIIITNYIVTHITVTKLFQKIIR